MVGRSAWDGILPAVATAATATESDSTAYAAGFTVRHADSCTLVDIVDPWDTTRLLQRYVLVDRSAPLPDSLPEGTLVRVPLQRVVVYSAVHCGMLEELGVADRIAGVCESRYIDLSFVREGIERERSPIWARPRRRSGAG